MATKRASSRTGNPPSVSAIISRFKESGALIHWAWKTGMAGKDLRAARELTIGVLVEQFIEDHLLGQRRPMPDGATPADVARALNAFSGFTTWAAEHQVALVSHQVEITSSEHGFRGKIDAIVRFDGELLIGDWKTSSGVYLDHLLQLAAYRILLRERDGSAAPQQVALIRIDKEDGTVHPHFWSDHEVLLAEEMFLVLRKAFDIDKQLKAAS